jgi:hypothetical protein
MTDRFDPVARMALLEAVNAYHEAKRLRLNTLPGPLWNVFYFAQLGAAASANLNLRVLGGMAGVW